MHDRVPAPKRVLQSWPQPVRMNLLSPVIKHLPFSFQVDKETAKTAVEVQKSSASLDTGGTALEEVGMEKPETNLGCLSSQAGLIHQEQQPAAIKRYALFHFLCIFRA